MKLNPTQMMQAEFARNQHVAKVDSTVTLEDVLAPDFWSHVAVQARRGDHIEVYPDDFSWYAELLVVGIGEQFLKVRKIRHEEFVSKADKAAAESKSDYIVKWTSNQRTKHRVIRVSDKEVMKDGFDTIEQANEFIKTLRAITEAA